MFWRSPAGPRFFWNVTGSVGKNSPNQADDVELIQFCCLLIADGGRSIDEVKRVTPGAPCSGADNDPLVIAIKALEKANGTPRIDGWISRLPNDVFYSDHGKHQYVLTSLNALLMGRFPDTFPRIDQDGRCPPRLKEAVKKFFAPTS